MSYCEKINCNATRFRKKKKKKKERKKERERSWCHRKHKEETIFFRTLQVYEDSCFADA